MKKIVFLLLFMFILPFVNSELSIEREHISTGETLLVKLQLVNTPLSNIKVTDFNLFDAEGRKISAPFFIIKFTDKLYYLYFTIPNTYILGTYTLKLNDYFYLEGGVIKRNSEQIPFDIIEKEEPTISMDPAAVYLNYDQTKKFNLNIKNNGLSSANVSISFKEGSGIISNSNFSTIPGLTKQILISFNTSGNKLINLKSGDKEYNLPIYLYTKTVVIENKTNETKTNVTNITTEAIPSDAIKFIDTLPKFNFTLSSTDERKGELKFKNFWKNNITNIRFYLTGNLEYMVELNQTKFDVIAPGETQKQYVWINQYKSLNRNYEGSIVLEAENIKLEIPVYITYFKPIVEENETEVIKENYTEEIIELPETIQEPEKTSNNKLIALIGMAFVVIVSLIIFYRSEKAKKERKPLFIF